MNVVYQNKLIPSSEIQIGIENRGFLYGDGFFETFFFNKDAIPYLNLHLERLQKAASILDFSLPQELTLETLSEHIKTLCQANNLEKARIKIIVWRKEGGYYTPTSNTCEYLITSAPLEAPKIEALDQVGIDKTNLLAFSPSSCIKTLSSIKYVLSGNFKKKHNYQDVILLDQKNNVSEMLFSNIFWVKNNRFYTPDIKTGCIEGIMRNLILDYLKQNNIDCTIGCYPIDDLLSADSCFSCNSLSILPIQKIETSTFEINPTVSVLNEKLLGKYL